MSGPYFVTNLNAEVRVTPNMMTNNIIERIKHSLEYNYVNKCFLNYGYIEKIYGVDENIGIVNVMAEDFTNSGIVKVNFKCRICNPIEKTIIVGKITGINNVVIKAQNGPIKFIINGSDINKDNIQFRNNAYYPKNKKGEIINKQITNGTWINIKVMGKRIRNRSSEIFVLGYIDSVIDDEDVIDKLQETFETEEYMDFNKKDKKLSDNKNTESGDYDYDIESDNSDDEGDDDDENDKNDKEESGNETED
jgi:DNA-directed RNA polymerase subunit E'/Rpb7